GVWYNMEQEWKQVLSEVPPKKVSVSIEPVYGSSSVRPVQFEVYYQIEGKLPEIRTILNQAGG
ncbi:TPA: DNA/RNA non-specific endonuclease, partial [Streptococcus suis]|nr:DNA/RNA non-specific endonuclease [Streptococcus suis]